jgi:hypothetical protein
MQSRAAVARYKSGPAQKTLYELARGAGLAPNWMLGRLLKAVLAEPNIAINRGDGVKAPPRTRQLEQLRHRLLKRARRGTGLVS